ncbi:MAG: adenylyl-sulfate kinase, partial [Candidatus Firestonebacteria bacterium GWA2_43_8]
TVIGRLLSDTGSLPNGKLEFVKENCRRNAKPFEYAFLLDALKDEQAQGITIDTCRCFFKTGKRDYIIIDAPGHIEFLKNMITGAARAEAALLVIDANEGVKENSKRHGYLVSMLGIKQVVVLINKMDLAGYGEETFNRIKKEYSEFLSRINVKSINFIPISAREGDNMIALSEKMPWYKGVTVLSQLDLFVNEKSEELKAFRFPVQDTYKFTNEGDERRIVAGTIVAGSISEGDEVVFLPSLKKSRIKTIEAFNTPKKKTVCTGEAVGFTLETQIYTRPGEIMIKAAEKEQPKISNRFKANVFWVGRAPMIKEKTYKLKLATGRAAVKLVGINHSLDASDLSTVNNKKQIDRHDVAECVFETMKPIAFDSISDLKTTGRFVIVDNYEIAGGGIVLESVTQEDSILKEHIRQRENIWEKGLINPPERAVKNSHKSKFIVFTGMKDTGKKNIAKLLEKELFEKNFNVYYLGMANIELGLDSDIKVEGKDIEERIRRLGELARILTDTGLIFITTIDEADDYDIETLKLLNEPNDIIVVIVGENSLTRYPADLELGTPDDSKTAINKVVSLLKEKEVIVEYYL